MSADSHHAPTRAVSIVPLTAGHPTWSDCRLTQRQHARVRHLPTTHRGETA